MLWLDVGDTAKNVELLFELRDRVLAVAPEIAFEWSSKEGVRSCSVRGEPVENLGWKTPESEWPSKMVALLEGLNNFRSIIEPHLMPAYDKVCPKGWMDD